MNVGERKNMKEILPSKMISVIMQTNDVLEVKQKLFRRFRIIKLS